VSVSVNCSHIILQSRLFQTHCLYSLCVWKLADLSWIWLAGSASSCGFTCPWLLIKSRGQMCSISVCSGARVDKYLGALLMTKTEVLESKANCTDFKLSLA
jgi:hypothetical protein